MTSLAQQLQKLAVPQTSILTRDKKRASLLFDPKEAASIDRDTFYDIGLSGLKELIKLNPQFANFQNNLYSSTARQIERSVENVEINDKLDRNVKKFMCLLGPYLLLKPAQKALEWLIHRFAINEYNKDDCVRLILPYHETNVFVKFLQILNVKNDTKNDKWNWLREVQKGGIHLPKSALFNHAAQNSSFLKFVCEMTVEACKENGTRAPTLTTLFSFFCTTIIGALEKCTEITEPQISALLPTLLRGMSSEIPDFRASCYLIFAKILKKAQLSPKILKNFTQKLLTSDTNKVLSNEALLVLVLIYQTQNNTVFHEKALDTLESNDYFFTGLAKLTQEGTFTLPLTTAIVKTALKEGSKKKVFEKIFEKVKLEDWQAEKIILEILENIPPSKDITQDSAKYYSKVIQRLETQYPNPFDKIVQDVMSQNCPKKRDSLSLYLNTIMKIPTNPNNPEQNIFEKLYHPNEKFRESAVSFFVKNFPSLNEKERSIFKNGIERVLLDESKLVIKSALGLKKKYLVQLLGEEKLSEVLTKLLDMTYKKNHYDLSTRALTLLSSIKVPNMTKKFLIYLPFLLPTNNDELIIALRVLKTDFASQFGPLKVLKSKSPTEITPKSFCDNFYDALCDKPIEINDIVDSFQDDVPVFTKYHSIILISICLPKVCHPTLGAMALKHILNIAKTQKIKFIKNQVLTVTQPECLLAGKVREIPLQGVLLSLENLLEKVLLEAPKGFLNFEAPDESLLFIKDFFIFLLEGCSSQKNFVSSSAHYAQTMKKFFQKCYSSPKTKIEFFANFIHLGELETQIRALRALISLTQKEEISVSTFLGLGSKVLVPSILVGLINPVGEVRLLAMELLKNLVFSLKIEVGRTFIPFLQEVYSRKEEILLDPEQLPLIVYQIYETAKNVPFETLQTLVGVATDYTNPIHIGASLAKILTFVNPLEVAEKFAGFSLGILDYVGNVEKVVDPFRSALLYNVILRLTGELAPKVAKGTQFYRFVTKALEFDIVSLEIAKGRFACPSVLALEQLRDVFSSLDMEVQGSLLKIFCQVYAKVENPEVNSAIGKVVKRCQIDAKLVLDILVAMLNVKSKKEQTLGDQKGRKKRSVVPTIDILETQEWVEGVLLLEFLQNKKKLTNSEVLLPVLFGILKKCLDFDEQASLEYPKQLILSTILHCCQKLGSEKPSQESTFNMELVVQCIRVSQNPQTHHHALLVLSHCAKILPEQVLHNIMAIFTFIGSSVLRHDDSYSFQIISQIIDNVIPILTYESGSKEKILGVLRVFVDVILDVPEHRRVPLFVKLLTTLGVEENLHLFLVLIFESHVFHNEKAQNTPRLQACHEILNQFEPEIIIKVSTKLLEYLNGLPESPEDLTTNMNMEFYLNFTKYTPKRFRHFKYTLLTFQSTLLSSKKLVSSIALQNSTQTLKMEGLYKSIIINILTYIQGVTKMGEKHSNSPQAQYYKVLLHHCYDILDSINALLTKEMFLLVIRGLVVHNIPTVRKKALELLNTKLQHDVSYFYSTPRDVKITEPEDLFALLPSLIEILRIGEKSNNEFELILQTALLTLKLLTKLLAEDFHEKFVPILTFISDLLKGSKPKGNILASTILCLAELVFYLRAHAISSIPKFMPPLLKILKTQKDGPNLLLLCSVTSMQKIIEALPLFLSPYLPKIIYEVAILSSLSFEDTSKNNLQTKLVNIRSIIGEKVPPRVLVPIVAEVYENLVDSSIYKGVAPLMDILAQNLNQLSGNELNSLLGELGVFFMKALDFRNANGQDPEFEKQVMKSLESNLDELSGKNDKGDLKGHSFDTPESVVKLVEKNIVGTLTLLVLKLSETTFRPFYYKLYDWAIRCEAKNDRIITFYRLSTEIAQKLKGLFALFAGHFLSNAAQILVETNRAKVDTHYFQDETKVLELLTYVLGTLNSIFEHDGQSFIDKDRFELLMQPLVDQLENTLDVSNFPNRCSSLLIPALSNFAISTADDTYWKQLNYQILLKTRHDNPLVRLQALKCLESVATKIGEDFLPLLPETIPFLAELLEDENEGVEKCCQDVVRELEQILGEPLQKYF